MIASWLSPLLHTQKGRKVLLVGVTYTFLISITFATLIHIGNNIIPVAAAIVYLATVTLSSYIHAPTKKLKVIAITIIGLLPLCLSTLFYVTAMTII